MPDSYDSKFDEYESKIRAFSKAVEVGNNADLKNLQKEADDALHNLILLFEELRSQSVLLGDLQDGDQLNSGIASNILTKAIRSCKGSGRPVENEYQ